MYVRGNGCAMTSKGIANAASRLVWTVGIATGTGAACLCVCVCVQSDADGVPCCCRMVHACRTMVHTHG